MFTILTNKKGVTLLEGMIAILLLSVVTIGTFGVVLSSSRKVSQPDIGEETALAIEQMYHYAQALSPMQDDYKDKLWGYNAGSEDPVYQNAMMRVFGKTNPAYRPQVERDYGPGIADLGSFAKWKKILSASGDIIEGGTEDSIELLTDKAFLPSLCDVAHSSIAFQLIDGNVIPLLYEAQDDAMHDTDIAAFVTNNHLHLITAAFTVGCQGYGI